jgi:hypothetical protein
MSIRRLLPFVLVAVQAAAAVSYAAAWQDELTVWTHAVRHAPAKPRPWINLAIAQLERREFGAAQASLDRAEQLAGDPRVPAWSRAQTIEAVHRDRLVLARAAGDGALTR